MESKLSYSDPHTSAGIQIANYDMENKSTPKTALETSLCARTTGVTRRSKDNLRKGSSEPFSYADSPGSVNVPTAGQGHNEFFLIQTTACSPQGAKP